MLSMLGPLGGKILNINVYVQWWIGDYHSMKIRCDEYSIFHISQSLFNMSKGLNKKEKDATSTIFLQQIL